VHQRRQRDLDEAQEVQRALLPQQLPAVAGYQFFAHYAAAQQVGGDSYDFIPLSGQRLGVVLGDVSGKGVSAALIRARFAVEARVCLETEHDLAAAVSKLNQLMVRATLPDRFMTLVALVLDPATHRLTLVNAGHPSPLLLRHASGQVEDAAPLAVTGMPIGIEESCDYACCEVELRPGDSLTLFSDGVTDAVNSQGRAFRKQGLHGALANSRLAPRELGQRLIDAVQRHAAGCDQLDDITLVCFGREPGSAV
jgi:serine phosphatase RsbU (regulator of sigma subunit)